MSNARYEWLHPHNHTRPALDVLAAAEDAREHGHRAAGEAAGAVWDAYAARGLTDEQMALGMLAVAELFLRHLQALQPGVDHLAAYGLPVARIEPEWHAAQEATAV
jgi:hypothetical protein